MKTHQPLRSGLRRQRVAALVGGDPRRYRTDVVPRGAVAGTTGANQVGFFEVIIMPLFETFTSLFPGCMPVTQQAAMNLEFWRSNPGNPPRPAHQSRVPRESMATLPDDCDSVHTMFNDHTKSTTRTSTHGTTTSSLLEADDGNNKDLSLSNSHCL